MDCYKGPDAVWPCLLLVQNASGGGAQIKLYALANTAWCTWLPREHHADLRELWKLAAPDAEFKRVLANLVSEHPTQQPGTAWISAKRGQGWRAALASHLGGDAPAWL